MEYANKGRELEVTLRELSVSFKEAEGEGEGSRLYCRVTRKMSKSGDVDGKRLKSVDEE